MEQDGGVRADCVETIMTVFRWRVGGSGWRKLDQFVDAAGGEGALPTASTCSSRNCGAKDPAESIWVAAPAGNRTRAKLRGNVRLANYPPQH